METGDSQSLSSIQIDESLEDRLRAHGITRRNVRSIIHGIFSDENVLKLLKDTSSASELDVPETRITRSRRYGNETLELDVSNGFEDLDSSFTFPCIDEDSTFQHAECSITLDSAADVMDINTESCFDVNGEFNWQAWLSEFDRGTKEENCKELGKDSDSDPDYNFLAEVEEQDDEDFRDDRMTRISKKELVDLTKLNKKGKKRKHATSISAVNYISDHSKFVPGPISRKTQKKAIDVFLKCRTMREKLETIHHNPALKSIEVPKKKKKVEKVKLSFLTFSESQSKTLRQQMQQHIQLLTQSCILGVRHNQSFETAATFLHEIEHFKFESPQRNSSFFNVPRISEAIETVRSVKSLLENALDGPYETSKRVEILAKSKAVVYKELLPKWIPKLSSNSKKTHFSSHEDSLIACGLKGFSGFYIPAVELISLLLMPCRTKEEISSRIKTAMRGNTRKGAPNPIFQFKTFHVLPEPTTVVEDVDPNFAVLPIEMEGELPNWLHELKQGVPNVKENGSHLRCKRRKTLKKFSARNLKKTDSGDVAVFWTRDMDDKILSICKEYNGPSKEALFLLSYEFPIRTSKQIENRFFQLLKIYSRTIPKS